MRDAQRQRHPFAGFIVAIAGIALVSNVASAAEAFTRSYDKEVEQMIETIGENEKRFEKALDKDVKKSVIRGPRGEVDVENYLKDLNESIEKLEERFDSKYSASAELRDVLDRASAIHGYVRNHQTMKGASEWDLVAASFSSLAAAYGAEFPLSPDAAVRRVGDQELNDAVVALTKQLDKVASDLKKVAKGTPELEAAGKSGKAELDTLKTNLKALKSRLSDRKPATAEARTVAAQFEKVDAIMKGGVIPASAGTTWDQVRPSADKIAQAFGITPVAAAPSSVPITPGPT